MQKLFFGMMVALIAALLVMAGGGGGATAAPRPRPTATPSGPTPTTVPITPSAKKIVGYFVQWAIYRRNYLVKNVDTSGSAARLTHINYAFSNIDGATLKCASGDTFADYNKAFDSTESVDGVADPSTATTLRGNFNQLRKLKLKYPHLKILISIGGWSWSEHFSNAALPENRAAFVASCIDMYIKGNYTPTLQGFNTVFDGIDIDWEYPAACGLTCNFRPEDTQNYTALLAEFRSQLNALSATTGKQYLLTVANPAGQDKMAKMELNNIHQHLDFINIMTYDFQGPWSLTTGMQAPLYGDPAGPFYANKTWADAAVQTHLDAGIPASKLVLGVPFYGKGWTGVPAGPNGDGLYQTGRGGARGKYEVGTDDYKELVLKEASYQKFFHPVSQSFYIYNGSEWWTYDNPQSVTNKMNYVKAKGLGGAMFWELSGDTSNINLLRAMYTGLQ